MKNSTVHISLAGGLGNQLFQIAASLGTTNGRVVVHDFLGNARRNSNNEPEIYGLKIPERVEFSTQVKLTKFGVRVLNLMYRSSSNPGSRINHVMKLPLLKKLKSIYFSWKFGEKLEVIHASDTGFFDIDQFQGSALLVGYFQSAFWPLQERTFSELQQISPIFPSQGKVARDAPLNKVMALHIRLGDYSHEPKIGLLSENYYKQAIDLIAGSNEVHEIWLFSDEPTRAYEYIPSRWKSFLKIIPDLSATETMDVMRDADYYVISNSSFSWWGALLSRTKDPVVVAPSPWFKKMSSPAQILPANWTGLESSFK